MLAAFGPNRGHPHRPGRRPRPPLRSRSSRRRARAGGGGASADGLPARARAGVRRQPPRGGGAGGLGGRGGDGGGRQAPGVLRPLAAGRPAGRALPPRLLPPVSPRGRRRPRPLRRSPLARSAPAADYSQSISTAFALSRARTHASFLSFEHAQDCLRNAIYTIALIAERHRK